jgi:hypothetical protein
VVIYELAERLGRQLPGHRRVTMALAVHPRKPMSHPPRAIAS